MRYNRRSTNLAVIQALRSVGGVASRSKLKAVIADDDHSGFSYNDVYGQIIAKKTQKKYRPFNFDFNFGLQELVAIGYIEPLKRGADIVLTELGRTANLAEFPTQAQTQAMAAYWEKKKQIRLARQASKAEAEDASDDATAGDDDTADDTDWQTQLLTQLKQFSPTKFESFARLLISKMGVTIDKTLGIVATADHGIDGYGYFESDEFRTARVAIQAKRYAEHPVSEPEIDKFKGVMDGFNAEYGIFITTSYFTEQAKAKAVQGNRIVTMIDGQRIAELVAQYQLFVTPVQTYSLGDYYFEQE
ncbi:restriction endonuclease [Lacticaseibacillus baoqingensis]|uniref:Restriction endonuclease n=1 Tax=Lacticaseibacillus baoqingensis TaxID=2486013 RepID=A0ABW4EC76_9LACO|nr:restriction endonuclease [Lacticaseibacillus baoqingensis]